jgi:hypothetical protein
MSPRIRYGCVGEVRADGFSSCVSDEDLVRCDGRAGIGGDGGWDKLEGLELWDVYAVDLFSRDYVFGVLLLGWELVGCEVVMSFQTWDR